MWTLELLMQRAAREPGFTFYTEQHPNYRGRPGDLLTDLTKLQLSAEQVQHLKRQVVEFKSGFYLTTDSLVAYALLNAPAWLAVTPGEWAQQLEPEIERVLAREAKTARPKRKRSK